MPSIDVVPVSRASGLRKRHSRRRRERLAVLGSVESRCGHRLRAHAHDLRAEVDDDLLGVEPEPFVRAWEEPPAGGDA